MRPPRVVDKTMGLTPAQFRRTLANAVGTEAEIRETAAGLAFEICWPDCRTAQVRIELTPQPDRRIAAITLPVTVVRLRLEGMDAAEISAFLTRFDLYYHRGGG